MIANYINIYCDSDITQIENYEKAISDTTQTWHCHHRKETDEGLTPQELKERGLYFNRPACELIFLTKAEHKRLHNINFSEEIKQRISNASKGNKFFLGKHHTEETKKKISLANSGENHPRYGKHLSEEAKKKLSESRKGENNPMFGKEPYIKGKHKVWDNKELNKFHYE